MVKQSVAASESLAVRDTSTEALAVAAGFDKTDTRGKEGIGSNDVTLPFLAITQKTSKQIDPSESKYIEGLKFLDLFNSITNEPYGQGPVEFIPIVLKKHAIEFLSFDSGGGIKDRDVPWEDDRCQFNGEEKPQATRFYDWAVLLLPSLELVVLSFKSTNIGVAKQFQQLIQLRQGPAFAGKYSVKSALGKNNFGTFGKFAITPAGKPTDEQVAYAQEVYESLKTKNIVVEHEAEPESTAPQGVTTVEEIPF